MRLVNDYTRDEMQTISYYCGDEVKILSEIENDCYVFDLHGEFSYNDCFEAAKNEYFASKKYNKVTPQKVFEFASYYIMKCEEYNNLWFKGRLDSNGNYEFTTNSEELYYLLESL